MLYEDAVHPKAVGQDWTQFRLLINEFGFERGRLISRLPEKWEKKVIQAAKDAGVGGRDILRMIEKLKDAKTNRKLLANNFAYDSSLDWVRNAIELDRVNELRSIISLEKIDGHEKIIAPDDVEMNTSYGIRLTTGEYPGLPQISHIRWVHPVS